MNKSKNTHGGKRINAGRKEVEPTATIRVPVAILSKVKEIVQQHKNAVKLSKQQPKECGCKILGYTATGKEIVGRCELHR